jgi:hypothetical protein
VARARQGFCHSATSRRQSKIAQGFWAIRRSRSDLYPVSMGHASIYFDTKKQKDAIRNHHLQRRSRRSRW